MAINLLTRFISNMTNTTITKPVNVKFRPYVRLEIPDEFQDVEEYVRIEINEDGEIEKTVGMKINDVEFEEVVGLELELGSESGVPETSGFDCPLDLEDYDACEDLWDLRIHGGFDVLE
jgi:hypothetical protein